MEREVVSQWIAEKKGAERHRCGDAHGAEKNSCVNGVREERVVIAQVPLVDHKPFAHGPEAVREHQRVGKQQKQADPKERRERNDRLVGA
jgi:hypothetical protein